MFLSIHSTLLRYYILPAPLLSTVVVMGGLERGENSGLEEEKGRFLEKRGESTEKGGGEKEEVN